jgi:hypothetical protein
MRVAVEVAEESKLIQILQADWAAEVQDTLLIQTVEMELQIQVVVVAQQEEVQIWAAQVDLE